MAVGLPAVEQRRAPPVVEQRSTPGGRVAKRIETTTQAPSPRWSRSVERIHPSPFRCNARPRARLLDHRAAKQRRAPGGRVAKRIETTTQAPSPRWSRSVERIHPSPFRCNARRRARLLDHRAAKQRRAPGGRVAKRIETTTQAPSPRWSRSVERDQRSPIRCNGVPGALLLDHRATEQRRAPGGRVAKRIETTTQAPSPRWSRSVERDQRSPIRCNARRRARLLDHRAAKQRSTPGGRVEERPPPSVPYNHLEAAWPAAEAHGLVCGVEPTPRTAIHDNAADGLAVRSAEP